ncbi:MAG TPA: hypothetical protein GXX20_04575 [Clostridiaceae bacterium]|nr:hypothetical protein [Clostridiaceae bacterium]
MKFIRNTDYIHKIIVLALFISTLLLIHMVQVVSAIPGEEDPLVLKSYLDQENAKLNEEIKRLNDIINELNVKADNLVKKNESLSAKLEELSSARQFEAIEVKAGSKVMLGASTEIVLRSGKATAIAGTYGGLADLAAGVDLQTGDNVTPNHLLLIARDDGRGIVAETDIWVLIKGKYTIETDEEKEEE